MIARARSHPKGGDCVWHGKYLGFLLVVGWSKAKVFTSSKNRVRVELNLWTMKKFSQAGRVLLLKTVIPAIPTYVMSCFSLPNPFLVELECLMENFFWHAGTELKIYCLA
ncbi:UNVERIFIED_CONTAM: hypothetical protein Slati_1142300 [Sesamum latifolium]|uniref:Uncharacterized protein n=1 Tax=Sesamum latifolium TaxID=2727402 RepID=A0AAW2XCC4_9LAMI